MHGREWCAIGVYQTSTAVLLTQQCNFTISIKTESWMISFFFCYCLLMLYTPEWRISQIPVVCSMRVSSTNGSKLETENHAKLNQRVAFYLLGGNMRGHLILSKRLWIWQPYTHHAAFAFTWQQWFKRKKKRAQGSRNAPANAAKAQKPRTIFMQGKEGGLRWSPFS